MEASIKKSAFNLCIKDDVDYVYQGNYASCNRLLKLLQHMFSEEDLTSEKETEMNLMLSSRILFKMCHLYLNVTTNLRS